MKMINISVVLALLLNLGTGFAGVNEDFLEAVRKGRLSLVQSALDNGANINAVTNSGVPALLLATGSGGIYVLKLLLDKGADVTAKDKEGYTALMVAVRLSHLGEVKLLLEKGADINTKNQYGETALRLAVVRGYSIYLVKLLLEKAAYINAETLHTALIYAAEEPSKKALRDFIDNLNKQLFEAAGKANRTQLKKALKDGAEIDAQDKGGNTALHLLAGISERRKSGYKPALAALMTQELLNKGALVRSNKKNETPIDIALVYLNTPVIKVYEKLSETRADIKTALDAAVEKREREDQEIYEEAKADFEKLSSN